MSTKIAQNIIKLENIIEDDYNIEVSSPGINRPLFNKEILLSFQGENTFVELKEILKIKSVLLENIVSSMRK